MPFHLPAPTRRRFIVGAGAGLAACCQYPRAYAEDVANQEVWILNDTHIGEKQPADSPVPSHLRLAVSQLLAAKPRPLCAIINGDLALKDGQAGDYRHFAKLIAPLQEANIDVHLTLGNHDHREVFYQVMKEQRPAAPPVKSRHISVIQTQLANFFLLDSLKKTMVTQGDLGDLQRKWLAQALDAHPQTPAIIVTHHNPRLGGDARHFPGGLIDSQELWSMLSVRPQVKAYIHGHIHDRSNAQHGGIHILNTPATSYVADPETSTTGWTIATLERQGVMLKTQTTDPTHPWHNEIKRLRWRA